MKSLSREFLGENPERKDLTVIFAVTLILLGTITYKSLPELKILPIWKSLLFLLTAADILAGAIGNFTKSTQAFYKNKPKKRIMFFFEHLLHIGFVILAIGHAWYCLALLAYTIGVGIFVNATDTLKQQEINASAVIIIGIILFNVAFPAPAVLVWLPSVFLIKLVFGFAIRRER